MGGPRAGLGRRAWVVRVSRGVRERAWGAVRGWSGFHAGCQSGAEAPAVRPYRARRRRSELRTTNTDEHAIAALASMGESRPAIASGTISTL